MDVTYDLRFRGQGVLDLESARPLARVDARAHQRVVGAHRWPHLFTTKLKVVVQSTLLTPRTNCFKRALPPRRSRDPLRLAEGGALP